MFVSISADERNVALQTCWCLCSLLKQHRAFFHIEWISLNSPGYLSFHLHLLLLLLQGTAYRGTQRPSCSWSGSLYEVSAFYSGGRPAITHGPQREAKVAAEVLGAASEQGGALCSLWCIGKFFFSQSQAVSQCRNCGHWRAQFMWIKNSELWENREPRERQHQRSHFHI